MIGVGVGLMRKRNPEPETWTPADLATPAFMWISAKRDATVTTADAGTTIQAVKDARRGSTLHWDAASSGTRPLNATGMTDGNRAIRITAARQAALLQAASGRAGTYDHAEFLVAEIDGLGTADIGPVLSLGSAGATSIIGTWGGQIWGGGNGQGSPRLDATNVPGYPTGDAIGPGYPSDPTAMHLWRKEVDTATNLIGLWCDGLPLYLATAWTPTLTAGSGLGVYGGFYTDSYVYAAVITDGIPSGGAVGSQRQRIPHDECWKLEQHFVDEHPSCARGTMVQLSGDSMVKASNLDIADRAANNVGERMKTQLATYSRAVRYLIWGNPGSTSSAILALFPSQNESCCTPINPYRVHFVYFGTNDLLNLASNASQGTIDTCVNLIVANYVSAIARATSSGDYHVVMVSTLHKCLSYVGNSRETARLQANALITALASTFVLVCPMGESTWGQDPTDLTVYESALAGGTHFIKGTNGGYHRWGVLSADTLHARLP